MNNITLAEAVKLKSIVTKKIQELITEIHSVSSAIVEKGETPKISGRKLSDVEAELAQVRKDSRTLDKLIYRANIDNTLTYNGEEIPIVEAIELASQLRAEASLKKELSLEEKEKLFTVADNAIFYRVTLYDPEEYRQQANELEKQAHRLSNAINAKNYQIEIAFNDSRYF